MEAEHGGKRRKSGRELVEANVGPKSKQKALEGTDTRDTMREGASFNAQMRAMARYCVLSSLDRAGAVQCVGSHTIDGEKNIPL